jgi:hypothetical protein
MNAITRRRPAFTRPSCLRMKSQINSAVPPPPGFDPRLHVFVTPSKSDKLPKKVPLLVSPKCQNRCLVVSGTDQQGLLSPLLSFAHFSSMRPPVPLLCRPWMRCLFAPALAAVMMLMAFSAASPAAELNPRQLPNDKTPAEVDGHAYDLVVMEATPGGIAMAVRAAREGLSVLLVQHNHVLGGMLSNGLGVWDTLYDGHRAPVYDDLRQGIYDYYRQTYGDNSPQLKAALPGSRKESSPRGYFEPHVAELVVGRLVARESKITVLRNYFPVAVERDGRLIKALTLKQYKGTATVRVTASVFADTSYEGDLMAVAKVPYHVGREARAEFDEPHAGVMFADDIGAENGLVKYPRDAVEGRLNLRGFRITTGHIYAGSTGEGDGAVQAFNFRLCLTSEAANRLLPEKPASYRREDFLKKRQVGAGGGPNGKGSWNEGKLPGENHAYPDGDWAKREEISRRHLEYSLGWMYFAQNDESLPADVRERNRKFGLCKDEFADNGNVPYELYVREARRLVGRYIFTEHDGLPAPGLGRAPVHADSIAITEWPMDSHECSSKPGPEGGHDGKVLLTEETRPGQVPYRSLLSPELDNLLVPGCVSCTHVGWGTIRLEPTWMPIAESAAFAAAQAIRQHQTPAEIDVERLLRTLAEKRVMLSFFNDVDMAGADLAIAAAQYFGTKGFFPDYNARLREPLKQATGKLWADAAARIKGLDPMVVARSVAEAEADPGTPMTGAQFAALLPGKPSGAESAISRGEALQLLWKTLP